MNLEQEFDRRVATLHRLSNPHTGESNPGEAVRDTRHAEFQVMADVFLGEDYDRAKVEQVENLQIALRKEQAVLSQRYKDKKLSSEEYVDSFNALLDNTFTKCEDVLGQKDFLKLFGAPRHELAGFIDKEAFLQA